MSNYTRKKHGLLRCFVLVSVIILEGCTPTDNNAVRQAQDLTPPETVILSAYLPRKNQVRSTWLGDPGGTLALTEAGPLELSASGTDKDGGVRAVRIYYSTRRSNMATIVGPGLTGTPAAEAASAAQVGEATPKTLSTNVNVNGEQELGAYNDIVYDVFAEAENFSGLKIKSGTNRIPMRLIRFRFLAVAYSDDDGTNGVPITANEFGAMVGRLNNVYYGTMIRFAFNPGTDFQRRADTIVNRDAGGQRATGNNVANGEPSRIVALLRWGPDASPTGNGNAYPPPDAPQGHPRAPIVDQRYVALPGTFDLLNQGFGRFFAHELGHFLGLYHTFPGWNVEAIFPSRPENEVEAAQAILEFMDQNGGNLAAFDGDGIGDTPPDPSPAIFEISMKDHCDGGITVNGNGADASSTVTFNPDPVNIMSYYSTCHTDADGNPVPGHFTALQIERMHATLKGPARVKHAQ